MDKKVTSQQVEQLYAFTRAHFVEYYDLQTELADHLANAIEGQWQTSPALSFDDALAAAFKKFGIFGFSDVVERRQAALGKKYSRLIWRYFKDYIRLPRIVFTLALVAAAYVLGRTAPLAISILFIVGQGLSFIKVKLLHKKYNAKAALTGKRWLLEEMMFKGITVTGFMGMSVQFMQLMHAKALPPYLAAFLALALVALLLHNYVVLYVIPGRAEEHLRETYPEYALEMQ